jgi:hypothetical protein
MRLKLLPLLSTCFSSGNGAGLPLLLLQNLLLKAFYGTFTRTSPVLVVKLV